VPYAQQNATGAELVSRARPRSDSLRAFDLFRGLLTSARGLSARRGRTVALLEAGAAACVASPREGRREIIAAAVSADQLLYLGRRSRFPRSGSPGFRSQSSYWLGSHWFGVGVRVESPSRAVASAPLPSSAHIAMLRRCWKEIERLWTRWSGETRAPLHWLFTLTIYCHPDGPRQIAPREEFADLGESCRKRRSPCPPPIANRAHTRALRAILCDVRKSRDWMVEQKGFEPSTPALRTRCSPS
jgi:hypothetical protein